MIACQGSAQRPVTTANAYWTEALAKFLWQLPETSRSRGLLGMLRWLASLVACWHIIRLGNRRNILAHTFWHIRLGTYTLAHTCWHTCVGPYILAHTSWHIRFGTYTLVHTSWHIHPGTYILAHMSWHMHPDTYIMARTSWHIHLGTYILAHTS